MDVFVIVVALIWLIWNELICLYWFVFFHFDCLVYVIWLNWLINLYWFKFDWLDWLIDWLKEKHEQFLYSLCLVGEGKPCTCSTVGCASTTTIRWPPFSRLMCLTTILHAGGIPPPYAWIFGRITDRIYPNPNPVVSRRPRWDGLGSITAFIRIHLWVDHSFGYYPVVSQRSAAFT